MSATECKNHPGVIAVDRCAGCAEAFCRNCMVTVGGHNYCASCKVMAMQGRPMFEQATVPSALADEAMKYGIISIFCFGIFTGPMAISKAIKAKKEISEDPTLTGEGKANAGLILGIIGLVLWVLGLFYRVSNIK
jgi:Domain of unknown function (DUF4190)